MSAGFSWTNPVVRGTAPDPSAVRVGQDYWLATSTFDRLPGIRIWHSVNLRDWALAGGAVMRAGQVRRDGAEGAVDLYAPTLRHHDGRFYLVCTNVAEGQGNFLLTAEDPAGPWSDALWLDADAFDPSLFFEEDGTCYYTRRTLDLSRPGGDLGPVVQGILDPGTGRLGPLRSITPGRGGWCSNDIEGPHLYRIGGWYYLFAAEGGTWMGHMQTVARSRSPWGPFEPCPWNPVLTHRHRVMHPLQSLGHADLVEDVSGGWWALALGTRHSGRHHLLGRETVLAPVTWRDGWPVIGAEGTVEVEMSAAASPDTGGTPRVFEGLWAQGWQGVGTVPAGVVQTGPDLDLPDPTTLLLPQTEPAQVFEAVLPPPVPGQRLGLGVQSDGLHVYRLDRVDDALRLSLSIAGLTSVAVRDAPEGPVTLRIVSGPETVRFFADGVPMGEAPARLLSAETCEGFTGVSFALHAEGAPGRSGRFAGVRRDDWIQ